jgi:hypothetical protein
MNVGATRTWTIGAKNPAFGVEGARSYRGTELAARRAANKIARAAGHGWSPVVRELDEAQS